MISYSLVREPRRVWMFERSRRGIVSGRVLIDCAELDAIATYLWLGTNKRP